MKKTAAILAIIAIAILAHAGPNTLTTNYFPNYIGTNIGGTYFACFAMTDMENVTTNEVSHTNALSDVREIMYSIDSVFYTAVQELTSTNRPAQYTVKKSAGTSGTTNIIVKIQYSKTTNIALSDNDIVDE